ncbi:hypothetical protein [Haloglomus halophilum]|uniref:hypothetical protein n=1 Tax=Haloglomus halophilum TaxID=2962672 RepID=UPI0020C98031|nr:hypothetical protein [Haloglomus halophilum]
MPISDGELEEHYHEFTEQAGEAFTTERIEKKQEFPDLVSEERVTDFNEGDIRELVRNLWAFRGWTNKDYLVGEILEDGIENVRSRFHEALYETDDIAKKFDILTEDVNMLGPASITEILTFLYPDECAIYNRRAREALQHLGYDVPSRLSSGDQYIDFLETVNEVKERLDEIETESGGVKIEDLIDVDYFLFYVSELDLDEEDGEKESETQPIQDFDHEEFKGKLLEIGDGLGFDVEEEYEAGPGARLDVRWSTRVANLGVIAYAFEVHRKGSRDSALLNLMKAQNSDPTLQKLVIVSTQDEIDKFKDEADAISADLAKSLAYFEAGQVQKAEEHLADLKDILQTAELMVDV